ncbi:uncharacterized protein LOC130783027 [Actinidia eriantha]|uniref:uncharacterized protein LOC130783027 n=1 Tax=Actinidia eriantha TaxID=165200 RepID=UPI002583EB3C|nr:uncharacterized protein LOC130783027 [Actinidia eriantha]
MISDSEKQTMEMESLSWSYTDWMRKRLRKLHRVFILLNKDWMRKRLRKLQNSRMLGMQCKCKLKANSRVIEELELAGIVIEETPPVIKEAHVIVQDTTEIDSFTAECNYVRVAKRKHGGPMTHRSQDQNLALIYNSVLCGTQHTHGPSSRATILVHYLGNKTNNKMGYFPSVLLSLSGELSVLNYLTEIMNAGSLFLSWIILKSQIPYPERNYHCFYLLCLAPPEDKEIDCPVNRDEKSRFQQLNWWAAVSLLEYVVTNLMLLVVPRAWKMH